MTTIKFSEFVTWNTNHKEYTINKRTCQLDGTSAFAKSIGNKKSINTAQKATLQQLEEYIQQYADVKPRKYKKVSIKINYKSIEEIIAAVKVFVLVHNQYRIENIFIEQECKQREDIKPDIMKFQTFLNSYESTTTSSTPTTHYLSTVTDYTPLALSFDNDNDENEDHTTAPSQSRKRRKLSDNTYSTNNGGKKNGGSRGIIKIITKTVKAVINAALAPVFTQFQQIIDMLADIHATICPVENRVNSKYRKYFQMDIVEIVDKFDKKMEEQPKVLEINESSDDDDSDFVISDDQEIDSDFD